MSARAVYIVDGARTPFLKARGGPGPFTPVDLAVQCGRPLLLRQPFDPGVFDQVILGCVNVPPGEMNPARVAALRLGMGDRMVAFTVQINCGSGMQSIDLANRLIREGKANLVLAGGAEALSHAPLIFRQEAVEWFGAMNRSRSLWDKARQMTDLRPDFFRPVIGLQRGLTDPVTEMNMGQTAELLGHLFDVSRADADRYAAESHRRLARAYEEGLLDGEIEPAFAADGRVFEKDDGLRADSSVEKLAKLEPAFEKPFGRITAGNSSQITDGACWTIVASEEALRQHRLEPRAKIIDSEWSALDPSIMGLGPVLATAAIMKRQKLGLHDIELLELNEAFAAQVLACKAAFADADFCREVLRLSGAIGAIDLERLNVDGGAISLGHPVGTSGNRIVLHLVNAMRHRNLRLGIATECIGGGQGGAMLIETV